MRPPFPPGLPTPRDPDAFFAELERLRAEAERRTGPEDLAHLLRMERWGRAFTLLGFATAPWLPSPVGLLSVASLAAGRSVRWMMIAHHVSHRAYDRIPGAPHRLTSRGFAQGRRRYLDWLDWILPGAWHQEHDLRHHPRTGEEEDPDLVERNLDFLRNSPLPLPLRYAVIPWLAATWKYTYYAASTLLELRGAEKARTGKPDYELPARVLGALDPRRPFMRDVIKSCLAPYIAAQFVLIPALFLPLGWRASLSVLVCSLLAELLTNLHTFAVIVPNHAGEDLYRFGSRSRSKDELLLRQIVGSVNYRTGGDANDMFHGWLNYQIEHHLFPNLTMLQYRWLQPQVKALCEAHGVPYQQESIGSRVKKTADVMTGRTTMKRAGFAEGWTPAPGAAE